MIDTKPVYYSGSSMLLISGFSGLIGISGTCSISGISGICCAFLAMITLAYLFTNRTYWGVRFDSVHTLLRNMEMDYPERQ